MSGECVFTKVQDVHLKVSNPFVLSVVCICLLILDSWFMQNINDFVFNNKNVVCYRHVQGSYFLSICLILGNSLHSDISRNFYRRHLSQELYWKIGSILWVDKGMGIKISALLRVLVGTLVIEGTWIFPKFDKWRLFLISWWTEHKYLPSVKKLENEKQDTESIQLSDLPHVDVTQFAETLTDVQVRMQPKPLPFTDIPHTLQLTKLFRAGYNVLYELLPRDTGIFQI